MSSKTEKPFYVKPPLNILFELNRLKNQRLWEIKVSYLLRLFIEEMEKLRRLDFRASGVALDSSAEIYLMKARLLLKLEEPPPLPVPPRETILPTLFMPARYELTSTTLKHLLEALDEALKDENLLKMRKPVEVLPPPLDFLPPLDKFLLEIEENMDKVLDEVQAYSRTGEVVSFSKIVKGLERIEAIKVFIILLFLAQRGRIILWQDEKTEELYVTTSKVLEEKS
ncbi:MAG: hypothetical protein QXL67_00025 [Candidatus Bathyarchaeia archaeon]